MPPEPVARPRLHRKLSVFDAGDTLDQAQQPLLDPHPMRHATSSSASLAIMVIVA
jgi:hypothetical protein